MTSLVVTGRAHSMGSKHEMSLQFTVLEKFILAAIAICAALQLHIQFVQKINWDEFYFLSMIYEHQRGELTKALQTFHVHLFSWLPELGFNEVKQIEVARVVMWFCELGTMFLIYAVMRTFISRRGALVSVLAYISYGFVFVHGTSFRADPIAAVLMMLCLFILSSSQLKNKNLIPLVVSAAMAVMVTVKVIFFLPALLGAAVWRMMNAKKPLELFIRLSAAALAILALCGALYMLQLAVMPSADTDGSQAMMSSAYKTTLLSSGLFPRVDYILAGMSSALSQVLLLLGGGILCCFAAIRANGEARKTAVMLLILASPVLSLVIYRNAFPYFFAFILPPVMGLAGYAFEKLKAQTLLQYGLVVAMLSIGISQYVMRLSAPQSVQSGTVEMVHKIFPSPVSYIDRCAMISSFSKNGFFMSTWGALNYKRKGIPVLKNGLETRVTPLLIINTPILEAAMVGGEDIEPHIGLLDEDVKALRQNFIAHWGHIWVAGKNLTVGPQESEIQISIPGTYTVEAENKVSIDGKVYNPQSIVHLVRGVHKISSSTQTRLTLRWGEHLYMPTEAASKMPIFTGF